MLALVGAYRLRVIFSWAQFGSIKAMLRLYSGSIQKLALVSFG
jgi:hypothetical protein